MTYTTYMYIIIIGMPRPLYNQFNISRKLFSLENFPTVIIIIMVSDPFVRFFLSVSPSHTSIIIIMFPHTLFLSDLSSPVHPVPNVDSILSFILQMIKLKI